MVCLFLRGIIDVVLLYVVLLLRGIIRYVP